MIDVDFLDFLDRCNLPAPVYRTAVRMARLANSARTVVLTYEQARALAGTESDATVRAHLHRLHAAGVLWFRRNEVIRVGFYEPVLAERAKRALSARNVEPANTDDDDDDDGRALSARNVEPANTTRAQRAKRAASQQLLVGRLVGRQEGYEPTYLPGGSGGDSGLTPEAARTVALLTDSDFGMDTPTAAALARQFSFEQVRAHAFAVLADMQAGKVRSVYVLPSRLSRGGMPRITEADRATALWKRHCLAEDEAAAADELRRRYIPPEYEDIIIG